MIRSVLLAVVPFAGRSSRSSATPLLRPRPLRWHLVALVLAAVLPLLVLSSVLTTRHMLAQRVAVEDGLRGTARALVLALDADIGAIVHTLDGAARAGGLDGADPVRALGTAAALREGHPYWESLFVTDGYGHVVLDTADNGPGGGTGGGPDGRAAPGAPLAYAATIRRAIASGQPAVSPDLRTRHGGGPLVAVVVPQRRRGLVEAAIGVTVRAERWSQLLMDQRVPADWLGVVIDQGGTILARAHTPGPYVGRPAPDWLVTAARDGREGLASGPTLDGDEVTLGFHRSVYGWTLGFAAPSGALATPLYRGLAEALLLDGALVAAAAFVALHIGRRVAAPVRALTEAAAHLEADRPLPPVPPSAVREINDLGSALTWAARRLHDHAAERRRLLVEEARRRREAELANASKTRFLAAASHDLRQPFQAMRLHHYLLEQGLADARAREAHRHLGEAMQSGEALLNALLDVSTLEAGTVRPHLADIDLRDLVESTLAEVAEEAAAKGLRLRCAVGDVTVRSDPRLLGRILGNLLSNAVRYTARGGVLVSCRRRGGALRIEVWDTGQGIPRDKIDSVFEDFVQLGNDARDHRQGLGLGLSVVQRTARLLGHPLTVRSRAGRGSLFAVTVPPGTRAARSPALPVPLGAARPRRVLLVEDHADQRQALARILEEAGHSVTAVVDGPEALAALGAADPPEIIVTDHRLPRGMTGVDVVEQVGRLLGRRMPAVIVTGDTDPHRIREAAASGALLLHKPIDPAALRDIVAGMG